ncbi:hypothetical protein ACSBR1_004795 [Camellia fascicularis]
MLEFTRRRKCRTKYCFLQDLNINQFKLQGGIDDKVLIEIFLEGGSEFISIVLDVGSGFDCQPVALLPTELVPGGSPDPE